VKHVFLAFLFLSSLVGAPLHAQRRPRVEMELSARGLVPAEGPRVRGVGLLADPQLRDLLHNGFPTRIHFRVELWSADGWFNDIKGSTEWDLILRYDALDRSYRLYRIVGEKAALVGDYDQMGDAEAAVEQVYQAPLVPRDARGRFYYNAAVDVETLSLTDLDELERWLRGDLRPAVREPRTLGTALTRGVRTLFVRLLGGDRRHYEKRSPTFSPS
jgi:hypothetical protein